MHFIPSLLTDEESSKVLVCLLSPQDRQGSRCNAKLLILPEAKDLVCTVFHLFMNTIITAGLLVIMLQLPSPLPTLYHL